MLITVALIRGISPTYPIDRRVIVQIEFRPEVRNHKHKGSMNPISFHPRRLVDHREWLRQRIVDSGVGLRYVAGLMTRLCQYSPISQALFA